MKPDVRIQALPVDGEAMYVLNRVNALVSDATAVKPSTSASAIATLIDFAFTEYVSPQAPESVFSLYVSGSKPDPIVVRRLNELTDVFLKLQHLLAIHRKSVDTVVLSHVGTVVQSHQNRNLAHSLRLLCLNRAKNHDVHQARKSQELPAIPTKAKTVPPLPFAFKVPPPLPLTGVGKSSSPAVLLAKSGKVAPPSLPMGNLGKTSPPTMPSVGVSGKATAPPTIGKALPPTVPVVKGAVMPKLPSVPTVEEVAIFSAPRMRDDVSETRKIHWQSIPVSRFKNSLFDLKMSLKHDTAELDLDLIDQHFVKTTRGCLSPSASPSRVPTAASSPISSAAWLTVPSVLETKRIQQIEIFLNGKKGFAASDVVRVLKTGGEDAQSTVELLETVGGLFPTAEERAALTLLPGRLKESPGFGLPKADSFLIDLVAIPDFQLVANYVIVLHTAAPTASEIIGYFAKLEKFFDTLRSSTELVRFFKLIGSLVAYLWNGKKATFNGFSVDMISQLKKVSSFSDKDYSVLHCLVELFPTESLDRLLGALAPVQELTEFDFADLVLRADEVQKSVTALKPERLDNAFYPALVSRLTRFKSEMEANVFPGLARGKQSVMASSASMLRYFAENEKKSINELLGNLNSLRNDLIHARMQTEKRRRAPKPQLGTTKP